MVFYRKYRPQSLSELLGQSLVKQILKQAFEQKKLAHAYLFCGPKGTGKTSTARILAKMVNCQNQESSDLPCNKCSSCLSITDGSNLDLIEIDAASNRGIDDIRELREKIKLSPTSSKKKVYIIDEVHMLTTEAFNALLKTLEEPPEHVLFILATTEVHKIPQTILSRVQKLEFKLASNDDLLEALRGVVKAEKIEADEPALKLIAQRSEGSFRDCLKLLDQLASLGQKITLKLAESHVNSGNAEDLVSLLAALADKDARQGLGIIQKQVEQGVNLKEFILAILENLRTAMLSKPTGEGIRLINNFLKALEQMKFASIPSLPLEVAVVESCLPEPRAEVAVVRLEENLQVKQSSDNKSADPSSQLTRGPAPQDDSTTTDDVMSAEMVILKDKWQFVLETIKPYNYSLEALLKQVKILSCVDGQVILEVPYSFHQRILEAPKSRDLLESVVSDILGKSAKVSCVLGQRPVRVEELANVEVAEDDEIIRVAAEIFNSES